MKILDDLEAAIPDMRDALGGAEGEMEGEEGEEEELPPLPEDEEEMPPMDEEEPADLDTPPPFPPMAKKKKPLPF